jgi:Trypsin-co-occurring domain 1
MGNNMEPPRTRHSELVKVDDAEFYVEVVDNTGPRTIGIERAFSLDGVRQTIQAVGIHVGQALQEIRPSEATVKFGLSLTTKTGKLTGIVVEGAGSATLEITLTWKDKESPPQAGAPQ